MKKTKMQKGITLVALIITIVVLLILAVVAIGAVRDSNIIAHAQNAAGNYNQAKVNEIDQISGYEELLSKYDNSKKLNPWQQNGLTVPVEYDKKYSGSIAEGLGISSLTIKLGSKGELIVEEARIDSTCNDSNITNITSNTITYNDDGTEIRIEYSADGKSAKVFYNNNEIGTLTVAQGGETIVPDTVWAQRGLTVQPVETDVTYSCEGTIDFGTLSFTNGLLLELHADGGFYISYGDFTEEQGTAVVSGNNTITFMAGEEETLKFVISNDATKATIFAMSGTWLEGDKALTLNTASAE